MLTECDTMLMRQINNAANISTAFVPMEPGGEVCLICPVKHTSAVSVSWKYGQTLVIRDGIRISSKEHLLLKVDTCNTSYHTLQVGNLSRLVQDDNFHCFTKYGIKATFAVRIQGKLLNLHRHMIKFKLHVAHVSRRINTTQWFTLFTKKC